MDGWLDGCMAERVLRVAGTVVVYGRTERVGTWTGVTHQRVGVFALAFGFDNTQAALQRHRRSSIAKAVAKASIDSGHGKLTLQSTALAAVAVSTFSRTGDGERQGDPTLPFDSNDNRCCLCAPRFHEGTCAPL